LAVTQRRFPPPWRVAIPTGDDAELFLDGPELLAVGDRLALAE
jgi:hypothetical protein